MDAVNQLEGFLLYHRILDIDPNHFPVIRINQVTIRSDPVPDQIISMITSQIKTAFADVFQCAA